MASIKTKNNLTEGSVLKAILSVALPLMASNVLQGLYNLADMAIVELSPVENAMGAVGISTSFINIIIQLFIGLSVGSSIVIAKHLGAGNEKSTSRAVHTAIVTSLIFGTVMGALGLALSRPVLGLMGAKNDLLKLAITYTSIYFVGTPFLALTNFLSSIYRAKGDTKTPLFVLSMSGILNVCLNLIFVLGFGLSVEGVSIATVASNAASSAVMLWLLHRDRGICRFRFKKLCFDKKEFLSIVYVGVPIGIQSTLFSLSNILIQSSILEVNNMLCPPGSAYDAVVKGNSASTNAGNLAFYIGSAFSQAIVSCVGQNIGAKKYDRVVRFMVTGFLTSAAVCLSATVLIILFRNPLFAVFGVTNSADELGQIAFTTATKRMFIHITPYAIFNFMDIASNISKALKKAITSTVIALIGTCLFRIVWIATVFRHFLTLESIYLSYPISWAITGAVQFSLVIIAFRSVLKRHKKAQEEALLTIAAKSE